MKRLILTFSYINFSFILIKTYGKDIFVQSCRHLKDDIEVFECDGEDMLKKIKDSDCHSILFLNIPSYAGGRNPWKNEAGYVKQSCYDGKLEVVGFHTLDFMFLQMGRPGDKIAVLEYYFLVKKIIFLFFFKLIASN